MKNMWEILYYLFLVMVVVTFARQYQHSALNPPKDTCSEGFYCNEKVFGPYHTMCVLPSMPSFRDCQRKIVISGIDSDVRLFIVFFHNTLRNRVAIGAETSGSPGPLYPAANMEFLSWNVELAKLAQRWANQCMIEGPDQNRNIRRYKVTQLVRVWDDPLSEAMLSWNDTLNRWYGQINSFSRNKIKSYSGQGNNSSAFTQMIWATTTDIGCGYNKISVNGKHKDVMVCNYGPGGNVEGEPVYVKGRPCTACTIHCSLRYGGLCGSPI